MRRTSQSFSHESWIDEATRLSEAELPASEYFAALLQRALAGLRGVAGAIWLRSPAGHLQLQAQANVRQTGVEKDDYARRCHAELLRLACERRQPLLLVPRATLAGPASSEQLSDQPVPANPTDFTLLLAPILIDQESAGLFEVWQDSMDGHAGDGQAMARMAALASTAVRDRQRRDMVSQQQLWVQLESFARRISGSLAPADVAFHVATEGRRLIDCDRLSVGVRYGQRVAIEAVSGVDLVEQRSVVVRQMKKLLYEVCRWGEPLVYSGVPDESLSPRVFAALDAYVAESHCKFLLALPLRDDREKETSGPGRSVLLLETFEPVVAPDRLRFRLEIVGRHAAGALFNAVEHYETPLRPLWLPVRTVQRGLGGKSRSIWLAAGALCLLLLAALIWIPYPLKIDARGQVLPIERCWVYSPIEGQVIRFANELRPGSSVVQNQALVLMHDVQLELKVVQLTSEIAAAQQEADALTLQLIGATESERKRISAEKTQREYARNRKTRELQALRERTHADERNPGDFWLRAPMDGTVLNWDFRENLTNRPLRPSEPLLRLGDVNKPWEIEVKLPAKSLGHIRLGFESQGDDSELDVDLKLVSAPTRIFKGKLARAKLAGEALPNKDSPLDVDPVVTAAIRIVGAGIPPEDAITPDLLVAGVEVHAKIYCGKHRLGYTLFHGIWEFFAERVLYFF